MNKLDISFFERDSVTVAEELVGKVLKVGSIEVLIAETEAYGDHTDLASHARFGKTERSSILFGPAGVLYIYLIYGMYYLTNIITGKLNDPGAVLIRCGMIISGKDEVAKHMRNHRKMIYRGEKHLIGPGKISAALNFDKNMNGLRIVNNDNIYIEDRGIKATILSNKRIGIDYAKQCKDYLWRFKADV